MTSRLTISLGGISAANLSIAFLTQLYILARLGPSPETDAFFAALTIPQIFLSIIGGSLTNVLVPIFSAEPPERQASDASTFAIVVFILFSVIAVLLGSCSGLWIPLVFPGFNTETDKLTGQIFHAQAVSMVLLAIAAIFQALHHSRKSFVYPELIQLATTLAMLVAVAFAIDRSGIVSAAWMFTARAAVLALFLSPVLNPLSRPTWRSGNLRVAVKRITPLLLGATYYKSGPLVDRFLASIAPAGGLSIFHLAQQVHSAAVTLINRTFTVPLLPKLAKLAKSREWVEYADAWRSQAFKLFLATTLGFCAVVSAGAFFLGTLQQIFALNAEHLRTFFLTATAMGGLLIGGALAQTTATAFYSKGDTQTPTRIGVIGFTVGVIAKVLGLVWLGIPGIALGVTVHHLFNAAAFLVVLQQRQR